MVAGLYDAFDRRKKRLAAGRAGGRALGGRILAWSIVALSAAMVCLLSAAVLSPRLMTTLDAGGMQPDGGQAFTASPSLATHWPYVIPSHPDFTLAEDDITLLEDGKPIGIPEASHAEIRLLGGGRFDFWQGTLWFSAPDGDPRDGGHAYAFSVRTRLGGDAKLGILWCGALLLLLIATEILRIASPYIVVGEAPDTVLGRAVRRLGAAPMLITLGPKLIFRPVFLTASVGLLAGFGLVALWQSVPLLYQADTYGYIGPGLRMADGQGIAGLSTRNLGYPLLTFLAIKLGSLADIIPLQFGMVVVGMACMLAVILLYFEALLTAAAVNLRAVPLLPALTLISSAILYCLLLMSHDGFMMDIYSLMAEAPHFLPMALALTCFVGGWATRSRHRRILLLVAATDLAFLSTVIKPSSLATFALCAVGLIVASVLHRRSFRSPAVVGAVTFSVLLISSVHHLDDLAAPPNADFSAKILFCNHLDAIAPRFDTSTPERAKVGDMIQQALSLGPHGWPVQGFDGDLCSFGQAFSDAIDAAAKAEGLSPKDWQMHEFLKGVVANPLRYVRHVMKQLVRFALYPISDTMMRVQGGVSDSDWTLVKSFASMSNFPRSRFDITATNWFVAFAPHTAGLMRDMLEIIASTFAIVAATSTAMAIRVALAVRNEARLRAEIILIATGAYTTSLTLIVAMSHSFDIGRYSVDILPFTLLWWIMGMAFILRQVDRSFRGLHGVVRNRIHARRVARSSRRGMASTRSRTRPDRLPSDGSMESTYR